jgi:5-formyltetrahydrofolate cyclo-ligase
MSVQTKATLRSELRKIRQAFVKQRFSKVLSIEEAVKHPLSRVFDAAKVAAGYLPVGSEADPHDVMTSALSHGKLLVLPCLSAKDAPLVFRCWAMDDPTETAPGGFQQPLSSQNMLEPDLILLPMLGFDRMGNRIGQGAGHYDRALELRPSAMRIGIAWSVQEVDTIPADPWDVPLDAIMTEAEWILPTASRLKRA